MPRHTPMDSDPSQQILKPEITSRHISLKSTPVLRWLLVAASLGVLLFI